MLGVAEVEATVSDTADVEATTVALLALVAAPTTTAAAAAANVVVVVVKNEEEELAVELLLSPFVDRAVPSSLFVHFVGVSKLLVFVRQVL